MKKLENGCFEMSKIDCIKLVRAAAGPVMYQTYGMNGVSIMLRPEMYPGLKESKDVVEDWIFAHTLAEEYRTLDAIRDSIKSGKINGEQVKRLLGLT